MQIALSEEQLQSLSPWLLSVAETGSRTIPWIKNAKDRDLVFYVTNPGACPEVKEFRKLRDKYRPAAECWILEEMSDLIYLFGYQYKYLKPIWGTEFPTWNIFDPEIEQNIKRYLIHWVAINNHLGLKLWYHVLTLIYLFQNREYSLTEEQQIKVQECHDRKMQMETYYFIVNTVNSWAEEFNLPKIPLDRILID